MTYRIYQSSASSNSPDPTTAEHWLLSVELVDGEEGKQHERALGFDGPGWVLRGEIQAVRAWDAATQVIREKFDSAATLVPDRPFDDPLPERPGDGHVLGARYWLDHFPAMPQGMPTPETATDDRLMGNVVEITAESGTTKYFYLKLGRGNTHAESWLTQAKWGYPASCIYLPTEAYRAGCLRGQDRQVWRWLECGATAAARADSIFVVIRQGRVWLLQPEDSAIEAPPEDLHGKGLEYPLVMPVRVLKDLPAAQVPAVLASLGCNQYHVRSTFTQIGHWGNLKAIDVVLERPLKGPHWIPGQGAAQLLECLSSVGLETLVARIFEASGCFVPAFVGGTIAHVDLFAENDGDRPVVVGGYALAPGSRAAVQVKQWSDISSLPAGVDAFVSLNAKAGVPGFIGPDDLLAASRALPAVKTWLKRSLSWLPAGFISEFGL